ncbi:FUSC family protein [Streptomyces sp. ICC1]|nr:FUSC family protein [Streptomyces sp. ICC1]
MGVRALVELRMGTGPLPAAARRAVRVTLAACAGFYGFLYGLDQPVGATYALFTAVSLGALSQLPGSGRQRAALMVRLLPFACALVAVGTWLAVRTWAAVAGMLVIGFCLAFGSAAGPRQAGAGPGLQLLYILPSFPPYAPDGLGRRLAGTVIGVLLLVLAERYLLPDPPVARYRDRAASAADEAARCAAALEEPPHTLSDAERARASETAQAMRPSRVPEAERPAGPGVRERALAHTGLAARTLLSCLRALPPPAPGRRADPAGLDLVRSVRESATATAALLREGRAPATGTAALRDLRGSLVAAPAPESGSGLRRATLVELADAALVLRGAAEIAVRGRAAAPEPWPGPGPGAGAARAPEPGPASGAEPPDLFWYARPSTLRLWWFRLSGHTGPRSVHFQNAVRLGLALAAARTVAGLVSLPHGFWAMLAVLSLTRTTAVQTRATVRLALIGTCLGALAAGGILVLAGEASLLYEIVLPPLMLVAFCVGPVRGVGWAQAMFTLVIAMAFAQLAPVTWQLAEVRFLDVTVGSAIGIVCGLLAWPHGAHDELGRAVAELLRAAADDVRGVTAAVGRTGPEGADQRVRHSLVMTETAYAQYQAERQRPAGPGRDWQAAIMAGHKVLWGNLRLLGAQAGPLPGPHEEAAVREYGARVAAALLRVADLAEPPNAPGASNTPGPADLSGPADPSGPAEPSGPRSLTHPTPPTISRASPHPPTPTALRASPQGGGGWS